MSTPTPYLLRELTATWSHVGVAADDIAPDTIVNQDGASLAVANGIDISQAKSVRVEVDLTDTDHVSVGVDVNAYTGLQPAVPQSTRNNGLDVITDGNIEGMSVTVGDSRLFLTLDKNDGNRADVVARVLIRI